MQILRDSARDRLFHRLLGGYWFCTESMWQDEGRVKGPVLTIRQAYCPSLEKYGCYPHDCTVRPPRCRACGSRHIAYLWPPLELRDALARARRRLTRRVSHERTS